MTAPTQKPEDKPARGGFRIPRSLALGVSACITFAVVGVALNQALPKPHTRGDYLIIGTLATLAALITIFAGLVLGSGKRLRR